jgi:protein TonB
MWRTRAAVAASRALKEDFMVALRLPAAVTLGVLVSVGLFSLLSSLVNGPLDIGKPIPAVPFNFTRLIVSTPIEPPRPDKLVPEPPVFPLGPTGLRIHDPEIDRPGKSQRIGLPTLGIVQPPETLGVGVDRDPLPIVRVDPDYPVRAIRGEIEGWVEVQFAVTATGAVRDVIIVDAHPKDIFDTAVIKAVERWRYNPKIDNGLAVERVGMRTRILFELDHVAR